MRFWPITATIIRISQHLTWTELNWEFASGEGVVKPLMELNAGDALHTSSAHVDDLKANVLSFSVAVSPDHQGLALLDFSFKGSLRGEKQHRENIPGHLLCHFISEWLTEHQMQCVSMEMGCCNNIL